ncbi:hypothetical protein [Achromobacter aloeverae]|uniref:hypothetical protein n=1 Tax=Achromobacter aloeverae TaxID=1750518 RepID=UPI00100FD975|nr:hypothetical protein [Achromobacter aloeverae]
MKHIDVDVLMRSNRNDHLTHQRRDIALTGKSWLPPRGIGNPHQVVTVTQEIRVIGDAVGR